MKSDRKKVTMAMLIATFLAAIEVTIVSTAMPRIVSELGGIQYISWVFAVYLLTSTVATPIFGKLADLYGRKRIFHVGAAIFLAGSMLSGLSQTMSQLICFRALQGIGSGAIMPVTFTIIGDIYPYEERAKVQGWFSSVWGLSGLVGPLVGGFLVDFVSWRWIFYLNLPFGIVSIILVSLFLKEGGETERRQIDYWGALTSTLGISALLLALNTGGVVYPWASAPIIGLFLVAVLLIGLFLYIEANVSEPMLPLSLFKIPAIAASNIAGFFVSSVLIALTVYLPLWVQGVHGQGATGSGLTLLPMSLGWPVGAVIGGRLMLRIGPRRTVMAGLLLIIFGTIWLTMADASTPEWVLAAIMLVEGFGFGFSMTVFTVIVQSSVGWHQRGTATAVNTLLRSLGQTVGVAVFGTMFNRYMIRYMERQSAAVQVDIDQLNQLLEQHETLSVSPDMVQLLKGALVFGLHHIYLILLGIALFSFIFVFWFPNHKPQTNHVGSAVKETP
ncbi:MDR family MFS transporter [Laceyella putida]|uniref:MDR family MFS transporter n=1 Tax=Laceyella putida TaxID=110101 RepID=A0ABW2RNP3_9BACL